MRMNPAMKKIYQFIRHKRYIVNIGSCETPLLPSRPHCGRVLPEAARTPTAPILKRPLLWALDQEGGTVERLDHDGFSLPSEVEARPGTDDSVQKVLALLWRAGGGNPIQSDAWPGQVSGLRC